jgi:hypothetical protein
MASLRYSSVQAAPLDTKSIMSKDKMNLEEATAPKQPAPPDSIMNKDEKKSQEVVAPTMNIEKKNLEDVVIPAPAPASAPAPAPMSAPAPAPTSTPMRVKRSSTQTTRTTYVNNSSSPPFADAGDFYRMVPGFTYNTPHSAASMLPPSTPTSVRE